MVEIILTHNAVTQRDYLKDFHLFQGMLILWILFIPLKNTFYEISIIGMILMFIYHVLQFKTYKILVAILAQTKSLFVGLGIIMLSMLTSSFLGIDLFHNLVDLLKFFYRFVAILFILLYFYQQQFFGRKFLITVIIVTLTVYALDGLYQYFTHYDLLFRKAISNGGLTGPTFSRNIFGLFMASYATLLFYIIFNYQINKYFFILNNTLGCLFTLSLFLLFHSLSRASWIYFVTFILLYTFFNAKKILFSKKNILLLVMMVITTITIFHFSPMLNNRLETLVHGADSGRINIWKQTLNLISNRMWFGYGVDSSLVLLKTTAKRIHNMTLEIALYFGIFGLISYTFLLGIVYKTIYLIKQYHYAFFLTSYLILLQFDGSLVNSKLHVSIFIVYLWFIYSHIIDKTIASNHTQKMES